MEIRHRKVKFTDIDDVDSLLYLFTRYHYRLPKSMREWILDRLKGWDLVDEEASESWANLEDKEFKQALGGLKRKLRED